MIIKDGVTVLKENKCNKGYTLFAHLYGSTPYEVESKKESEVYLIDIEGNLVHTWNLDTSVQSFCTLLPDGNLLYPTLDQEPNEEQGLREVDKNGNLLWEYNCLIDHDFQVLENGNFLINTIKEDMCPNLGSELKKSPYMIEVNRDKELVWEWFAENHIGDIERKLSGKEWTHVKNRIERFSYDWAHNNTLQVIPQNKTWEREKKRDGPARFKPGNIIFSYRNLDVIGVIDRETSEIVWAWGPGELDGQHKPHMLENGNILIFDNGTFRGYSRVIELNPLTEKIEWEYVAEPPEKFWSPFMSSAQRLPNGNTLICSGIPVERLPNSEKLVTIMKKPRFFEVTPEREIVWEYTSPYMGDEELQWRGINFGRYVYRCQRYSEEHVKPLL